MLSNIQDILNARGPELLQPIGFGKHQGLKVYELPDAYIKWMSDVAGISSDNLRAKIVEAKRVSEKPTLERRIFLPEEDLLPGDLWDHQRGFIERFGASNYAGLFAEMGTGKTRTAIEFMKARWNSDDKVLFLCPKSVFSSIVKDLRKYSSFTHIICTGSSRQKLDSLAVPRQIYITNWDSLRNETILNRLEQMGFTWIVGDESQYIKTPTAKVTKAALRLSANIEMRLLLTGTPITNRELDIWSQACFLDRGKRFGTSFYRFRSNWFHSDYNGWSFEMGEHLKEMFKEKLSEFSMRVRKVDCLDLPEQLYETRDCELTGRGLKAYQQMLREAILVLEDETIAVNHKIVQIRRLHQLCGGGINEARFGDDKLKELSRIIDDATEPVVIVAVYRDELRAIGDILEGKGKSYGEVSGSASSEERQNSIQQFSEGKLDAILLQLKAGGLGIDGLQNASSTMIFFSFDYAWDSRQQCEARIHRSGQKQNCLYVDLMATLPGGKPTIDHAIRDNLENKDIKISELIDNVTASIRTELSGGQ